MKQLPRFRLYVLASILIVILSKPSFACVCRGVQQPPCFAFQEATAVFAGEVVDISEAPFQEGETFHCLLIEFSVEESFKGISTPHVRELNIYLDKLKTTPTREQLFAKYASIFDNEIWSGVATQPLAENVLNAGKTLRRLVRSKTKESACLWILGM